MGKVVYSSVSDLRQWRFGLKMYRWRERNLSSLFLLEAKMVSALGAACQAERKA